MSVQTQYIILFVILAAVIVWIIYRLVRPKSDDTCSCDGCSIAGTCKKTGLLDKGNRKQGSCKDYSADGDDAKSPKRRL